MEFYMSDRIVIFGASGGAVKVAHTLKNIGIDFDFFVDNDSKKFGKILEGKVIRNPEDLVNTPIQYKIVIASMYHGEIEEQLLRMGIKKENIVLKEKYVLEYIDTHLQKIIIQQPDNMTEKTEDNILIDLGDGMKLGGIEKWGITLASALSSNHKKVTIITTEEESEIQLDEAISLRRFDLSFHRYTESIMELVDEITAHLPCTIIINRINQLFMASHIAKKNYGKSVKIISVLHSYFIRMYEQNELINKDVDAFMCVSSDIQNYFTTHYEVDCDKVYYKDSPIFFEEDYIKQYSDVDHPIRIGYGGRLERAQKRADLLIPLIHRLDELKVNYHFNIAGEGSYYDKIQNYRKDNSLEDRVSLLGSIPFDKMNDFWKQCDIFVNVSDIEGSSLSMLESMSFGVVPVVTDTSGAKSFANININGYVTKLEDVDSLAESIMELSKDREKLKEYGTVSRAMIKSRCNPQDYINYVCDLISN